MRFQMLLKSFTPYLYSLDPWLSGKVWHALGKGLPFDWENCFLVVIEILRHVHNLDVIYLVGILQLLGCACHPYTGLLVLSNSWLKSCILNWYSSRGMNCIVSLSYGKSCLILSNSGNGGNSLFQEWDISQISLMIKHLDLQTDPNLSVVLLSSDLPLVSPCEERPLASPCGANNPPPAACQSIIVIFGENKQKQSADKRKITLTS